MRRIVRHRHTLMFALAYGAIAAAVLFAHPGAGEAEAPATAIAASVAAR
ncbi:hypothetical protein J2X65_002509 [Ancylobacter sp. 3268]|nr:hypothetical protein [Ancylobacter sp. 3268]MDR6953148.1 hypothetical protein [Ancylobacter sp. 3268]